MADSKVDTASLQALLDAFNAHDVDAVMSFFTDDCVFEHAARAGARRAPAARLPAGPGRDPIEVRRDPGRHCGDDRHWTSRSAAATCSSSSTARSAARTHSGDRRLTRFSR
jgi:hypothetical protein